MGVDLEGEISDAPAPQAKKKNKFMFKDPEEYKDMSQEEKEKLTQEMMGIHRSWARSSPIGRMG